MAFSQRPRTSVFTGEQEEVGSVGLARWALRSWWGCGQPMLLLPQRSYSSGK